MGVSWTSTAIERFDAFSPTKEETLQVKNCLRELVAKRDAGRHVDTAIPFDQHRDRFLYQCGRFALIYSAHSANIRVEAVYGEQP